jgi:hypothetical protein
LLGCHTPGDTEWQRECTRGRHSGLNTPAFNLKDSAFNLIKIKKPKLEITNLKTTKANSSTMAGLVLQPGHEYVLRDWLRMVSGPQYYRFEFTAERQLELLLNNLYAGADVVIETADGLLVDGSDGGNSPLDFMNTLGCAGLHLEAEMVT